MVPQTAVNAGGAVGFTVTGSQSGRLMPLMS